MKLDFLSIPEEGQKITVQKVNPTDIAVIGIAAKMPGAENVEEYWHNLINGVDSIRPVLSSRLNDISQALSLADIDPDAFKLESCAMLDRVDCFDHAFFNISPREAEFMDPNQRIFLETAWEAFEDAGYGGESLNDSLTGIYVAVNSNYNTAYRALSLHAKDVDNGFFVTGNIESILASRISYIKNLKGPSMIIDTECSSSLVCLHEACKAIRHGDCDIALVGGIRVCLLPAENQQIFSSKDGKTRVFDVNANGYGLGEGSIGIIIKSYQSAIRDSNSIYAVIKGSAINQDGRSLSITAPNPISQRDVIIKAWKRAGINPEKISYIETHGTATKIGDPIEIQGVNDAFMQFTNRKQFCGVGSVKSNIGHLGNLSGLAGFLKMVLSIHYRKLPGMLHFEYPNPAIDFHKSAVYVVDSMRDWETSDSERLCGINSFGISGTNCHVLLGEDTHRRQSTRGDGLPDVFTLSAASLTSLQRIAEKYIRYLDTSDVNYHDLCYTVNTGRGCYAYRVAFIISSVNELKDRISALLAHLSQHEEISSFNEACLNDQRESEHADILQFTGGVGNALPVKTIQRGYLAGASIDWQCLYENQQRMRVHAPGYSFDPVRCWVKLESNSYSKSLYKTAWVAAPMSFSPHNGKNAILLILRESTFTTTLTQLASDHYDHVVSAYITDEYKRISEGSYNITGRREELEKIIEDEFKNELHQVVFATPVFDKRVEALEELKDYVRVDFSILFHLSSILEERYRHRVTVYLIQDNIFGVTAADIPNKPEHAMLLSIAKSMNIENLYAKFRCFDIDRSVTPEQVLEEIEGNQSDIWVAFRNQCRYVEMLEYADMPEEPRCRLRRNGVYIITGGMGQIGQQISRFIAAEERTNVVVFSRSNHNDLFEQMNDLFIRQNGEYCMKENGSRIICYEVDVSNEEQLSIALNDVRCRFGGIHGIIHCAGIMKYGSPVKGRIEIHEEFLEAKVYGTWLLDRLTQHDPLDFFILFSSFITLMGGAFSCEYAAANTYEDAFADYRTAFKRPVTVIDWTTWAEMVDRSGYDYDHFIYKPMSTKKALDLWSKVAFSGSKRVIIGNLNHEQGYLDIQSHLPFRLSDRIRQYHAEITENFALQGDDKIQVSLTGRLDGLYEEQELKLGYIIGNLLGISSINIDDDLFELGLNSILAIKLEIEAQKNDLSLTYEDVYSYNTVRKISDLLRYGADNDSRRKSNAFNEAIPAGNDGKTTILEPIVPFDEFYYRECYYCSLFAVLPYFGTDVLSVLMNEVPVYFHNRKKGRTDIRYISRDPLEELLLSKGISVVSEPFESDIISQIKSNIDEKRPILVWLDSYYQPFIQDVYTKEHIQHTTTVYGYDEWRRIFYLVDHVGKDSPLYKKQVISYEDLERACRGYLEHFPSSDVGNLFVSFGKMDELVGREAQTLDDMRKAYLELYEKHADEIAEGMDALRKFLNEMEKVIQDYNAFIAYYPSIIELFNMSVSIKKAEAYKMLRLFGDGSQIYTTTLKAGESWDMLRKLSAKIFYTASNYGINTVKTQKLLKDISYYEDQFIHCAMQQLNIWKS